MPPKGIDYSKWDKLQLSASDDEDDDAADPSQQMIMNDGDDDDDEQQIDNSSSAAPRDISEYAGGGAVRKLDAPSAVTFGGGGGVTVRGPVAAPAPAPAPAAAASLSSSDDLISKSQQPPKKQPPKSRWIRNGCLIHEKEDAAATAGFGLGLFWSQTSDSVSVGIVLEKFTFRDFLAFQEEEHTALSNFHDSSSNSNSGSLDATIRLWSSRKGARKVAVVDVTSVSSADSGGNPVCSISVTDKNKNKCAPVVLAYNAAKLDPDEFWSVQLVAASELGLSMLPPEGSGSNSADDRDQRLDTLLAVRAVVVELSKKATENLVSSVRHWWERLLLVGGGGGAIDVEADVEDRRDSNDKRAALKQAWEEAHDLFRERVAARKKVDPTE